MNLISLSIQSDLAITDVKNKVSVIARPPKFKFVRYSKVRLAGERLEKRPVNKVSVITRSVIARVDCSCADD